MGADVMLRRVTRRGSSPRREELTEVDSVSDSDDILVRLCAASGLPMLSRVDPYGDLVLSSDEMEQLVSELDQVRTSTSDHAERWLLDRVLVLARTCARDRDLRLWFAGD
ncbi:hypothetical protein [Antribacter gilvus]|uniref:hypothetical protein n=1 Tax=Antribacter gilvus TaxID=2304675 RepID=UPI000F78F989|nr:hypothetical protein [Antribacter gilvus]